jgi:WD40 repeat protein
MTSTKNICFPRSIIARFLGVTTSVLIASIVGSNVTPNSFAPLPELQPNEQAISSISQSEDIATVNVAPNDSLLVVGNYTEPLQLLSRPSGQKLKTLQVQNNTYQVTAFSPDSKTLAGATLTGPDEASQIFLWDTSTGKVKVILVGHSQVVSSIVFSPDGKHIASSSYDKTVRLWDIKTGELKQILKESQPLYKVAFSQDGTIINVADVSGNVYQWNLPTNALIRKLTNPQNRLQSTPVILGDFVYEVVFSPDGKLMARIDFDKDIRLWDLETGKLVTAIKRNNETTYMMRFSPDSRILATVDNSWRREVLTGGNFEVLRLWSTNTGKLIAQSNGLHNLAFPNFSSAGKEIITSSNPGGILIWDVSAISNSP